MQLKPLLVATSALISFACAGQVAADTVAPIEAPAIPLAKATFGNGKVMDLTVGYSSGAFHRPGDDPSIIYTITDRGPNIDCGNAEELIGLDVQRMCDGDKSGKVFPEPGFDPTIYEFAVKDGKATVVASYPLKGRDGKELTGLSIPLSKNPTEAAFGADGSRIAQSPNGFDSEALVKLKDGSFWISDEYGPSIAHLASDGTVLSRLVPAGTEGDYAQADYPAAGKLPAIIAKRTLNRGIESIGVSPDEATLYFVLQSPLSNPDKAAYAKSRIVRLFKFDRAGETVLGEYAYQLDLPDSFTADNAKKARKQSDVKLSEMVAIGADKLLVLERISKTTKLYEVDLAGAATVPAKFDDMATAPTLEQLTGDDPAAAGVVPLKKTLIFNSDDHKGMPSKIEGIAMIDPVTLILMTDNDFGIEGAATGIVKVTLDRPLGQ